MTDAELEEARRYVENQLTYPLTDFCEKLLAEIDRLRKVEAAAIRVSEMFAVPDRDGLIMAALALHRITHGSGGGSSTEK